MLRRYNPNKELKKIQGKGIYNRNFKLMIIGSVFALTALIAASFALWSFASEQNVAFNGKATKMLTQINKMIRLTQILIIKKRIRNQRKKIKI